MVHCFRAHELTARHFSEAVLGRIQSMLFTPDKIGELSSRGVRGMGFARRKTHVLCDRNFAVWPCLDGDFVGALVSTKFGISFYFPRNDARVRRVGKNRLPLWRERE